MCHSLVLSTCGKSDVVAKAWSSVPATHPVPEPDLGSVGQRFEGANVHLSNPERMPGHYFTFNTTLYKPFFGSGYTTVYVRP